jgi:hypothetical protein
MSLQVTCIIRHYPHAIAAQYYSSLFSLDMIMPEKNAREVYRELKKVRPDLKVLFICGCTVDIVSERRVPVQDFLLLASPRCC